MKIPFLRLTFFVALWFTLWPPQGHAADMNLWCLTGTGSTGAPIWQPASAANPCPTTGGGGGGGSVTQGTVPWVDDITQWANVALGAPSNYGTSPGAVVVPGVNAFVTNPVAITATSLPLPTGGATNGCAGATVANTKTKPFSNAGSATALLLVTGVAAQNVHVCSVNVGPVAGAVNVALVEGTTVSTACDTGTAGVTGGATAATGWQFQTNGGLTYGNGIGMVGITATLADNVCLFFSAGVQVSGVITYAVF